MESPAEDPQHPVQDDPALRTFLGKVPIDVLVITGSLLEGARPEDVSAE